MFIKEENVHTRTSENEDSLTHTHTNTCIKNSAPAVKYVDKQKKVTNDRTQKIITLTNTHMTITKEKK